MDQKSRLDTTKHIWTAVGWTLFALFLSAGIGDGMQAGHIVLGIAIIIAATGSTGFIWNFGDLPMSATQSASETEQEKVKRERLDNVLRDLSNDELIALKQRLSDGTIDDEMLYQHMTLSDDGELIPMERD